MIAPLPKRDQSTTDAARRERLIAAGLCVTCRQPRAPYPLRCRACLDKDRARYAKRKAVRA